MASEKQWKKKKKIKFLLSYCCPCFFCHGVESIIFTLTAKRVLGQKKNFRHLLLKNISLSKNRLTKYFYGASFYVKKKKFKRKKRPIEKQVLR